MQIEKISYASHPDRVYDEAFDCIWVSLAPRKTPSPLESQVLQWVDWRLQGQISRLLLNERKAGVTFIPTFQNMKAPLLAVCSESDWDWGQFCQSAEGLGLRRALILCERASEVPGMEKELRRQSCGLDKVVLGSDGPVGKG